MFQTVHAQTGPQHQREDDEHGGKQLLALPGDDLCNDAEGIVIGVDPEEAENPDDAEHPEGYRAVRQRQIPRKEAEEVHQAREGGQIAHGGETRRRVKQIRCPHPQGIVHREKNHRECLRRGQNGPIGRVYTVIGGQYRRRQIHHNRQHVDKVISPAQPVPGVPYLHHLKNTLFDAPPSFFHRIPFPAFCHEPDTL